jgi:hypothetical protein
MTNILRRTMLSGALAFAAAPILAMRSQAAPAAELWEKWRAHNPASRTIVDQSGFADFLRRYLAEEPDGINRVRYAAVSAADKAALARHVEAMARVPVLSLNQPEQFAYWINLYNALTVKVVLDHYPVGSIREISLGGGSLIPAFISGGSGPWGAKLVQIEGEAVGLDDIEHRILRPLMRDNRVHYAVNCASIGCPTLQPKPFTAAALPQLLDHGARLFVNHPRGARLERDGLIVSSLYRWYQADFGGNWQGVLAHLRRYAAPSTAALLAQTQTIAGDSYDWRLNDAASYARTAQAPLRS